MANYIDTHFVQEMYGHFKDDTKINCTKDQVFKTLYPEIEVTSS
ncbi:hypothetical protein [Jeotgalibacillus soli]|nr:hypothetical protein [Jeotgalibacillus soli]